MLSAPSRLSNTTAVRDRRPRRSSHNSSSVEAVGGALPESHPRGGGGGGGGAPSRTSSLVPHPPRPRGGAVVPGFPRPPISQPHAGGVAPPIVRSSASHPPRLPAVAFELQSLTTKSRARGSDPTTDNVGPIEAPDAPALQTRNTRNAWATTTVAATVITLAEPKEDTTTTEHMREPTSRLSPGQQEEPSEERHDTPPLPLTPSDTNLPPVPPSPPPDPQPTMPKSLRPQRPQRTRRGCGGATSENRSDESVSAATSHIPIVSVVADTVAPPTESAAAEYSNSSHAEDESEDRETTSVETPELEAVGPCRRPTSPPAAVTAGIDASFRARRARARPRTLPLAIFCGDNDDSAVGSSLCVNIVPAHDDVPLTLRDYAALVGHVLIASEGAPSDDESSAQKAECILGAAVTRHEPNHVGPTNRGPEIRKPVSTTTTTPPATRTSADA